MSAPVSPSDFVFPAVPRFVRARGAIRARFEANGGGTAIAELHEAGGYRLRFPRGPVCEGVIVNTGGGVAGGDAVAIEIEAGPQSGAVVTTVAAEKIYRADGVAADIDVSLNVAAGARLAWLPQETILFSGARLRRRLHADIATDACLTLVESYVFGRGAMGERMEAGALGDQWRIRRGGRLVFAEALRLEGDIAAQLSRPAVGQGAASVATILHIAPEAEGAIEAIRALLADEACESAASAFDGMLVARFTSPSPEALRGAILTAMNGLRGIPAPRVWQG